MNKKDGTQRKLVILDKTSGDLYISALLLFFYDGVNFERGFSITLALKYLKDFQSIELLEEDVEWFITETGTIHYI